ncbi:nuclear transport factor 2 family protein [Xenorhabdus sp. PB30.3]|uniref:nuclear transport factor 2 family protein n=1 Tax=Xenorhabdus sp. PB30.3 TaxID=2788941 RepID=UPI001E36B7D0|nr:nuclear transport factor 2 family protein [Xenorhabdus sp. PB30.3]MCC8380741.1 nuclear transport factor 2 family protein [Xenorhabdus sp. PB30.3]
MSDNAKRSKWVYDFFEFIDNREFNNILNLVTEDVVYERPGYSTIQGKASLFNFYSKERVVLKGKHTITNIVTEGSFSVFSGIFSGTLKNKENIELSFCDFCQFDNHLLSKRKTFFYTPLI